MLLKTAFAAAGLALLTACGATSVDIPVVEDNIKQGIKEQNDVDVSVDCPNEVDWKKGESFTCDVEEPDGTISKATVTMKDDDGNVSWKID